MSFLDHIRATWKLGLPVIGSHLAQFAIIIVDTIMLGWYGVPELAASVLAGSFYHVVFIFGSGFGIAVMPMVAEALSIDDAVRIRRVTRMGLWLSIIYALFCLPALWWSGTVMDVLGQQSDLAEMAQSYLRIVWLGIIPALMIMVLKSYLTAQELAGVVLWVTLGALGLNTVLNYALIFGNFGAPELGLEGAAWATVISQWASLFALALYAARSKITRDHALFQRLWRSDPEALLQVFRLGLPIGLTLLAESGMFSAASMIVGLFGEVALAAHGVALQITALTFMAHLGLSQAATVRASRAYGHRDWPRLSMGGWAALILSLAIVLATIALFLLVPELLISGFLDPNEPARAQIIAVGTVLLAVAALFQFVDAGQVMALGMLRGIQDTKWPMIMASFSYWIIGIPASYALAIWAGWGAAGAWLGLVIGLALACGLLWGRYFQRFRQLQNQTSSR